MIVELLAHTVVTGWDKMHDAGWVENDYTRSGTQAPTIHPADELAEFAGRLCYQSWDRPNPATATNAGYLGNILRQEHFSVLEHASATFYVAGVSRSLSHELVRHRHLSFSQVSQRYVDESNPLFIMPPAVVNHAAYVKDAVAAQDRVEDAATIAYKTIYEQLIAAGLNRKAARGAARAVLPNATETKFVVTGNMRAWRDVIKKRISPAADEEIQHLARYLLAYLREIAPNTFQDADDWT